ncbi:spermatogenesis-associated protein 1 isoform X1 [Alligator sinensis]|uniref:Spermatogenesis-associated protein 1 isoform X1 n=1 Tax=Alligator sinensis TaxID=38654 RepID=A0A1U7SGF8_ALLSI|nr:spermatogenesis-associated protein 1 isoform X1 [Alligator sinensis]XP_025067320.1 spermatogenesis-associated protein 1 isoform X1 [Alligator sinensis]XP_025067321.1 spermatogenesis-associated protein 1 isoform X1 [Alligator sinensis]XP_025067322.1 spermatogenesis-associated protein 1 isoform X1 [Alligator sinensis]XP_025067323.1 spermatogenesis-associated protein 1 isoform X1 [Alligator sinensis]XP_025067325.1 spermatogenesis-associated protein 1 isoform X1 [Alligator sinensis]XP_02506732
MSFSQTRPPTSELVELHVFYVPEEVWNFKLNTISADHIRTFISAGFIRASPCLTLRTLREQLGKYLGENAVTDKFRFLKCIGKKLAVVKAKQETELELKLFAPPYALYPELYFLPGLDHLESIYSSSSTTSERQHFYEDPAVFSSYVHGSNILNLPKRKLEKSLAFLEGPPINHLIQNQEEHSSSGWNKKEKETIQVLHDSKQHEGVQNNRNQEKLIPQRRKDQTGSQGSLCLPGHLNPAKWESERNPASSQNPQQTHLSENQKECNTLNWNEKDKGTIPILHVKENHEQKQNNQTQESHIPQRRNDQIPTLLVTNMEYEGKLKGSLERKTTENSRSPESLEDNVLQDVHNKKSHQQITGMSVADIGGKQDDQTAENNLGHPAHPSQYISPPAPPLLTLPVDATEVAKIKLAEELEQRKAKRLHMERIREELIKKAKGLLEQNQLKRYHARQAWKKKYFETKKATASLEDNLNKLRQDLELSHQKLLSQLEARDSGKRAKNATHIAGSKNATIIQITTEQHAIDHLKRKLDNIKMKLIIEIKMRKQAASDLRVLRAELAQKKIQSSLMLQTGKLVI